jgi:hypothetical protein
LGKIYTEWEKHAKTAEKRLGEEGRERMRLYVGSRGYKEPE